MKNDDLLDICARCTPYTLVICSPSILRDTIAGPDLRRDQQATNKRRRGRKVTGGGKWKMAWLVKRGRIKSQSRMSTADPMKMPEIPHKGWINAIIKPDRGKWRPARAPEHPPPFGENRFG